MRLISRGNVEQWEAFTRRLDGQNPVLSRHLREWQNRTIGEYADYLWNDFPSAMNSHSQQLFHTALSAAMDKTYRVDEKSYMTCDKRNGAENTRDSGIHSIKRWGPHSTPKELDATLANRALSDCRLALSAHHTAPLFHPLALQSLLVPLAAKKLPHSILVLSTDWVPMDNLFFPKGILLPSVQGERTYSLFSKRCNKTLVACMPAFTQQNVDKVRGSINKDARVGLINARQKADAFRMLEEFYCHPAVLAGTSYKQQCANINYLMCKKLFPDVDIRFVSVSDVAVELCVQALQDSNSLLSLILFHPALRLRVLSLLNGITGCWDSENKRGSLLFWRVEEGRMQPCFHMEGDHLVFEGSDAEPVRLPLSKESVVSQLRAGQIIPGMFLVFTVLMFTCGLPCVGGMRQIAYCHSIREKLAEALAQERLPHSESVVDFPVEMCVAGLYPHTIENKPAVISDLLYSHYYSREQVRKCSLKSAVLAASRDLLSLS